MTDKRFRIAAAVVALAYIAVQGFQDYVFRSLPSPESAAAELVQGAEPLHLLRSTLMLLAMFGLLFVNWVICAQRLRERPVLAVLAFVCFLLFGFLEIGLRSIELFWTQVDLPAELARATDAATRAAILDKVATFQAVQRALYFPLMLSSLLGSIAVFFLFATPPRINYVIKAVMAFTAVRLTLRLLTMYAGIDAFPTPLYHQVYFAMVVVVYAPKAYWLFALSPPDRT